MRGLRGDGGQPLFPGYPGSGGRRIRHGLYIFRAAAGLHRRYPASHQGLARRARREKYRRHYILQWGQRRSFFYLEREPAGSGRGSGHAGSELAVAAQKVATVAIFQSGRAGDRRLSADTGTGKSRASDQPDFTGKFRGFYRNRTQNSAYRSRHPDGGKRNRYNQIVKIFKR